MSTMNEILFRHYRLAFLGQLHRRFAHNDQVPHKKQIQHHWKQKILQQLAREEWPAPERTD